MVFNPIENLGKYAKKGNKLSIKNVGRFAKKGYKFSDEELIKFRLGKNNPFYNKKHSIETKEKMSLLKKESYNGENNPNWHGGKSFEPYDTSFTKELKHHIRTRDCFQCQICGKNEKKLGYNLSIHHIDYNKNNNDYINLISLCKNCHTKTNFDRRLWKNYFKNIKNDK